jgi:hypothetical protein
MAAGHGQAPATIATLAERKGFTILLSNGRMKYPSLAGQLKVEDQATAVSQHSVLPCGPI